MAAATPPIELVVFDCDGVLINTEHISIDVDVRVLAALGWSDIDRDTVIDRFLGRSHNDFVAETERVLGRTLEPGWDTEFQEWYEDGFARELVAMDGVLEVFEQLEIPFCVASSSGHAHLERRLTQVGLWPHVAGRIFSAEDVGRGKPFPDLFLHAAERMGADPSACLVVEDSVAGIEAATAAGMQMVAYGETVAPRERFPADVAWIEHMRELPALIGATV